MVVYENNLNAQPLTGRYMSLPLRGATIFWLKKTVLLLAPRPAPAPAGDSHGCHGFCQRENKVITA